MDDSLRVLSVKLSKLTTLVLIEKNKGIFNRNDNIFNKQIEAKNPVIFSEFDIGYVKTNNLEEYIFVCSEKLITISEINIPSYGMWNIFYNFDISSDVGCSIIGENYVELVVYDDTSEIVILNNKNTINLNTNTKASVFGNEMYNVVKNMKQVKLRTKIKYRNNNYPCNILIVSNDRIYNPYTLKIVRIG